MNEGAYSQELQVDAVGLAIAALEEIASSLEAADRQSLPSDDPIIIGRLRASKELARFVVRILRQEKGNEHS